MMAPGANAGEPEAWTPDRVRAAMESPCLMLQEACPLYSSYALIGTQEQNRLRSP